MITLGIETATTVCSVGLSNGEEVLAVQAGPPGRQHSERLLLTIDAALAEADLHRRDLQALAVSAGPGSFTGLRIGLSTAKGVALGADLPLTLVSTLKGLAANLAEPHAQRVCPMLDARRDLVYAGIYRVEGDALDTIVEDAALAIDRVIEDSVDSTVFVGEGAVKFEDRLRQISGARIAPAGLGVPDGGTIARLGARQVLAGDIVDTDKAEPNYCRASQAERERAKQSNDG